VGDRCVLVGLGKYKLLWGHMGAKVSYDSSASEFGRSEVSEGYRCSDLVSDGSDNKL
jgi:hypothetical protein